MKRKFILLIIPFLSILLSTDGFTQISISKGLKGGLNFSDITGDDVPDETERRNGFNGGVFVNLDVAHLISIRPEIAYSQRGATVIDDQVESQWNLSYIEVPVLFKVKIPMANPTFLPGFFAGPSFAYLLNSDLESGETGEVDLKDHTKSIDVGIVVGFGIGFGPLSVDARYNFGLNSIDDGIQQAFEPGVESEDLDFKNQVISINGSLAL